jgi:hypothetical protein
MSAVLARRRVLLALPFVALWLSGLILYSQFNWVFDYRTIEGKVAPYAWVPYGLPRVTVEVLILYLLLRPGTFRWSWGRVLIALALFIPWFVYSIRYIMHAPGWVFAHGYWLIGVMVGLTVLFVVSVIGAWLTRTRAATA